MLNLPKATEINKLLAKKALYASAKLSTAEREAIDANVKKLTIVHEVFAHNVNIEAGDNVTGFYVLLVSLKKQDYDDKVVERIFKLINQRLVLVLQYEDVAKLAVFHNRLFTSDWKQLDDLQVKLQGINFSQVWQNILLQVSEVKLEQGKNLDEQLATNDMRAKLQKKIATLEKKARAEKQSKKKFALVQELKDLTRKLEEL